MRRSKKKYKRPLTLFDKDRIERERELLKKYGLKNKREIWRAETLLRKYRGLARMLAAQKDKKREEELLDKLNKLGILEKGADLDDVLTLTVDDILKRRLQTILAERGLVSTVKQARQFITHGHITISGRKISYPSYLVPKEEEDKIDIITKLTVTKQVKI